MKAVNLKLTTRNYQFILDDRLPGPIFDLVVDIADVSEPLISKEDSSGYKLIHGPHSGLPDLNAMFAHWSRCCGFICLDKYGLI